MPSEFTLIHHYFLPLTEGRAESLALTDDAALLSSIPGQETVITKDLLVENVHFFPNDDPYLLAKKALRVNLSDLAAMGAAPTCYLLGLVLPKTVTPAWLEAFSRGLKDDNQEFGLFLAGGDTTAHDGPLIISITALGEVPSGKALRRNGAKPGDRLYVSGTLGDAALGLQALQGKLSFPTERYYLPQPRIELGKALRPLASACLDISDGLVQDVGHIAAASQVAIEIQAELLPLSPEAKALGPAFLETILTGGDDYELAFTAPSGLALGTCIGTVREGKGVTVLDKNGKNMQFAKEGFTHF